LNKKIFLPKLAASIVVLLILFPWTTEGQSTHKRVKEGNELYSEKQYDQALNKYQDALLSDPENNRIQYNVANTLYWKKKFAEALQEYQKVVGTEELPLEAQTYFNMGNTLYRLGKLPESILAYQQALKIDPNDMDAKYNLEFVRRKIKENAEKHPQENQPQPNQEQQETQQKQEKEEDQDKQENQGQQNDQQEKEGQESDPQNIKEMSQEEAERILNALKNDEKDIQKKRRMKASGKVKIKKDWSPAI